MQIAIPSIITNITVPLLGMVDVSIGGHLGNIAYIGAVATGSAMFSLAYWGFGFLRMGTTGITAQAYGARSPELITQSLTRGLLVALIAGLLIVLLQAPIARCLLSIIAPSPRVALYARQYFDICVWGAPALLCTMVIKGWLLGMQDAKRAMLLAVGINLLNVVLSLVATFVIGIGFAGIAIGTLLSEWCGLVAAAIILKSRYPHLLPTWNAILHRHIDTADGRHYFRVNSDIFLRSLLMLSVSFAVTAIGARIGDTALAANAVIMQLFLFYSYFVDGFAFAGESIVGKYYGARDYSHMHQAVCRIFRWAVGVAAIFIALYGIAMQPIVQLLTPAREVVGSVMAMRPWCIAIVAVGVLPFVWDGVFVGLTATRAMLVCTISATAIFFIGTAGISVGALSNSNHMLWLSFVLYLAVRGIVLTVWYFRLQNNHI